MTRQRIAEAVNQRIYGVPVPYLDPAGGPTVDQLDDTNWKLRGRCTGQAEVPWFDRVNSRATRTGQAVCRGCPVRRTCLAYALTFDEEFGVWGGYTAEQRAPMLAAMRDGFTLGEVLDIALTRAREAEVA